MEKRADLMYKIGKVFAIIGIVFISIAILGGIVAARNPAKIYSMMPDVYTSETQVYETSIDTIIKSLFYLAEYIALLVLLGKARQDIEEDKNNIGWHIALLVIGAFSFDIFCLLGGIFAIVAMNQKYLALKKANYQSIIEIQADEEHKDEE